MLDAVRLTHHLQLLAVAERDDLRELAFDLLARCGGRLDDRAAGADAAVRALSGGRDDPDGSLLGLLERVYGSADALAG